jgi:formylglycine-generating enzyme required for sulfatase activity
LPSEAEWEYACRAGTTTAVYYNVGDRHRELDAIAWWNWNAGDKTHPVKQKLPNAFGLYDMIGNVWEWCFDWYGDYPSGDVTDPKGPNSEEGYLRVYRGGGWGSGGSWDVDLSGNPRSACRAKYVPSYLFSNLGFRPALSPVRSAQ